MCYANDFSNAPASVLRKNRGLAVKAPPVKKARNAKKSVRFSRFSTVQFRASCSEEEQRLFWNQTEDVANIRSGIRTSIAAMHAVNGSLDKLDSNEHCYRGLEAGISTHIMKLKRSWIKATAQNVMDEQRLQKCMGVYDPDRIALISARASIQARKTAAYLGVLDAKQCQ